MRVDDFNVSSIKTATKMVREYDRINLPWNMFMGT